MLNGLFSLYADGEALGVFAESLASHVISTWSLTCVSALGGPSRSRRCSIWLVLGVDVLRFLGCGRGFFASNRSNRHIISSHGLNKCSTLLRFE